MPVNQPQLLHGLPAETFIIRHCLFHSCFRQRRPCRAGRWALSCAPRTCRWRAASVKPAPPNLWACCWGTRVSRLGLRTDVWRCCREARSGTATRQLRAQQGLFDCARALRSGPLASVEMWAVSTTYSPVLPLPPADAMLATMHNVMAADFDQVIGSSRHTSLACQSLRSDWLTSSHHPLIASHPSHVACVASCTCCALQGIHFHFHSQL